MRVIPMAEYLHRLSWENLSLPLAIDSDATIANDFRSLMMFLFWIILWKAVLSTVHRRSLSAYLAGNFRRHWEELDFKRRLATITVLCILHYSGYVYSLEDDVSRFYVDPAIHHIVTVADLVRMWTSVARAHSTVCEIFLVACRGTYLSAFVDS